MGECEGVGAGWRARWGAGVVQARAEEAEREAKAEREAETEQLGETGLSGPVWETRRETD